MKNENMTISNQLPPKGKLIKSTIIAVCIATIILLAVVLPAEYGIDPTGVGKLIGLAKMGEIKVSLAQNAAMEKQVLAGETSFNEKEPKAEVDHQNIAPAKKVDSKTDKITLSLEPNDGQEIKLTMAKGTTVDYSWYTDGGKANFDAHADSKELEIDYHNYRKGKLERSEGIMEAAFDGNHGWFWRNRTSETMTLTLEVSGDYTDVLQY
jgi:hypothetical protein